MDISVIIPLFNEDESLPELFDWINKVMEDNGFSYEVICIDDGSTDDSWKVIEESSKKNVNIRGISFQRNYGKSAALNTGFQHAQGDVVITMDADLQDSPDEIPGLYEMIMKDGFDLVSGWKKKRYDPIMKTVPSKFFNKVTSIVSGIKLHDFNCGLKAYKLKVVRSIEVYGEMHRYIPVIAKQSGFPKIGEKIVQHRERKYGVTKFGLERFINGFLDLMSVTFVTRFSKKPMHFFGLLGTIMFVIGFIFALYLGIDKFLAIVNGVNKRLITSNPSFYAALTAMIMGTQLFLTGFLADLISRSSADRNLYIIGDRINIHTAEKTGIK